MPDTFNYLFEIQPIDPATTLPVTIRMAHHRAMDGRSTTLDGKQWLPAMTKMPTTKLTLQSNGEAQPLESLFGVIEFALDTNGFQNLNWMGLIFDGATGKLWRGVVGDPFSAYRQIWSGRLGPMDRPSDTRGRVSLFSPLKDLEKRNLLTDTYAGTGDIEGDFNIKGNYAPYVLGQCTNVELVKVDPNYLTFQYHAYGSCPISALYVRAMSMGAPVADYPTYAALKAATIPLGKWASATAVGCVRFGSEPGSKVTGDVGTPATIGTIVTALLTRAGFASSKIDAPSMAAATRSSCLYATQQIDIMSAINQVAFEDESYLTTDAAGKFYLANAVSTATPIPVNDLRNSYPIVVPDSITQPARAAPVWSIRVGHSRVWSVMTPDEISPSILELTGDIAALDDDVAAAQQTADIANSAAQYAVLRHSSIANDNILDRTEKQAVVLDFQNWTYEKDGLIANGTNLGLTNAVTNYQATFTDVKNYLESLTPPYSNTAVDSAFIGGGATYVTKVKAYEAAKVNLTTLSLVEATKRAEWPKVTDPVGTKPTDNSTVNIPGDHMVANANFYAPLDGNGKIPNWTVEQSYPGTVTRVPVATDVYVARFDGSSSIRSNPVVVNAGETLYWRVQYRLLKGRNGTTAASDTAQIWALIRFYDASGTEMFGQDRHIVPNVARSPFSSLLSFTGQDVVPSGARTAKAYFTMDIAPQPSTPSQAQAYCGSIDFDRSAWGSTVGAQSGQNLLDANGVVLSDYSIVTQYGTSADFVGRGPWARENTYTPTIASGKTIYFNTSGYATSQRVMPTNLLTGLTNNVSAVPTAADQGSGTGVTITIPAHTRSFAGASGTETISYNAGTIANLAYSTLYYVYCDDPTRSGGAVTYAAITNPTNMVRIDRLWIRTITTPASGGGPTTGGGGGGGGYCVSADSFMPDGLYAHEVEPASFVLALDYGTMNSTRMLDVESNVMAVEPCVRITSASGIALVASTSTPVTLRSGEMKSIVDCAGRELPVQDGNGFRWETITEVNPVGMRTVARIRCHGGTYAAGEQRSRFIFTHNPAKP